MKRIWAWIAAKRDMIPLVLSFMAFLLVLTFGVYGVIKTSQDHEREREREAAALERVIHEVHRDTEAQHERLLRAVRALLDRPVSTKTVIVREGGNQVVVRTVTRTRTICRMPSGKPCTKS